MVKKVGHVVVILNVVISCFAVALTITPLSRSQYTPHDPIYIVGDEDFAVQAAEEGWPGDGSEGNPYIIEGYEISAAKANGIEIKSTTVYFIIKGTLIKGGKYRYHGIDLDVVINGTVKNCTFEMNNYGIYIYYSNDNEIVENTFNSNYNQDIRLGYSSRNTLTGNRFVENGISISGNSLEHWNTHDIDTSNKINDKLVYYWKNQTGGTVPLDAGQIILANCTDVLIENQELTNTSIGIQLGYSSSITIKNNNVTSNNRFGIYLYESDNNTIIDNNASNNGFGIFLEQGSSRNHIMNNNFSNNSIGVDIKKSNDNHITNNLALNVWSGISIFDSYYNVITDNIISTDRYEMRRYYMRG
ncbi:MAG: right-handed parallel beta-helix repeat-containing protein, partial [Thermoplasmata archaeon]